MQHPHQFSNANGSANYVASYDPDQPVSFTAVEGPVEQEAFWPFGPTDESDDTSGLFGSFGGLSQEETGGPALRSRKDQSRNWSLAAVSSAFWLQSPVLW